MKEESLVNFFEKKQIALDKRRENYTRIKSVSFDKTFERNTICNLKRSNQPIKISAFDTNNEPKQCQVQQEESLSHTKDNPEAFTKDKDSYCNTFFHSTPSKKHNIVIPCNRQWRPLSPIQYSFKSELNFNHQNPLNQSIEVNHNHTLTSKINNSFYSSTMDKLTKCDIESLEYQNDLTNVIIKRKELLKDQTHDNCKEQYDSFYERIIANMNIIDKNNNKDHRAIENNKLQKSSINRNNYSTIEHNRKGSNSQQTSCSSSKSNLFNQKNFNNENYKTMIILQEKKDNNNKELAESTFPSNQLNKNKTINSFNENKVDYLYHQQNNYSIKRININYSIAQKDQCKSLQQQITNAKEKQQKLINSGYYRRIQSFNKHSTSLSTPKANKKNNHNHIKYHEFEKKSYIFNSEVTILKSLIMNLGISLREKKEIIKLNYSINPKKLNSIPLRKLNE